MTSRRGSILFHLAKFAFHNLPAAILGVPSDFMAWGLMPVAGLHLLFGALGGLVGWLLRTAWTSAGRLRDRR